MRPWLPRSLGVLIGLSSSLSAQDLPLELTPTALRCEARVDPLGIDERAPRLSWQVVSSAREERQTAYRLLVASDPAVLREERGDLWDSGKVESDETIGVVYGGRPLASHQLCRWKVRVWDRDGKPSAWSSPAMWSMGILEPSGWKAGWIGYDKPHEAEPAEAPFEGAQWIWHAGDRELNAPKGHRLFRSTLELPAGAKVEKAELLVAADDKYRFVINTELAAASDDGGWERPRLAEATQRLRPGSNDLRVEVENSTEGPAGLLAKLTVRTAGGKTFTHVTDGSWKSAAEPGANWHNREIDSSGWPPARVLGEYGMKPWGKLKLSRLFLPPATFLRTEFNVSKGVKRAMLYSTALGIHDDYLNGGRASDDRFNPGWTDYAKRVYYRAYDVTARIQKGSNVLGAILADGWYSGHLGWQAIRDHYGKRPRFRAQLRLEYEDGTSEDIATGPGWKAATGPILEADFLMGETHDARLALDGWDRPGYDGAKWSSADAGAELKPAVEAHPGPPVRAFAELKPVKVTEPKPGAYVLDMGQNFAGVVRLRVSGQPGQKIALRFAERLNPDGTIYVTNLRTARATDTYICRGGGEEVFEPRFTFHGFQYVEVTGLAGPPAPDAVTGVALSSDTPAAGSFECSDSVLEKLHSNIYWTQRANFIDIPTDCPQRDERLGWTGDAQVYIRTATLNADVQAFFTKWLVDLEDAQRADGQFPMVAPLKVAGGDGGPTWADAGVICPWTIYQVYGDRRLLERRYPAMARFVEFCRNRSKPDLLPPDKFHCFGDWLNINADTPKEVIYTAYFAGSAHLTALAAEVLGKKEDAARYSALYEQVKAAFNKAYVAEDGRIRGDTQAGCVLAIAFDLLDPERRGKAARRLVEDIESRGGHLSTGFIGTKDLMLVLAKIDRYDVAYTLLHKDTFPSWGFSIQHGATSIWERWDGWTPQKGFQDPGMNSFAHYSFGAVYQWMVENIGGIRNDGPSYKRIVIAPQPDRLLSRAATSYDSVRGRIATRWSRDGGRLRLEATIPANTTATVHLPAAAASDVTEGGIPLAEAQGVKLLGVEGGRVAVAIGSGTYRFASTERS